MVAENLKLIIEADVNKAIGNLKVFQGATNTTKTSAVTAAKAIRTAFIQVAAIVGTVRMITRTLTSSINAWNEQEDASAKLAATLRATGNAAGISYRELSKLAEQMQKTTTFSDDMAMNAQAVMLTFREIGRETFPRAMQAAADMSVMFGGDLQQATIQLGKALNDPREGLSALRRIGVSFTEQQRKQIEGFVDANNIMGAQAVILKELEKEFGGVSQAMAMTSGGALKQLRNAWGDIKEEFGRGLSETLTPAAKALTAFINENKGRFAAIVSNFPEIARIAFMGALDIMRILFKPSNLFAILKGLAVAFVQTLEVAWNYLPRIAWERIKLLIIPLQFIGDAFIAIFDSAWATIRNAGADALNKLFGTDIKKVPVPNLLEGMDKAYDKAVKKGLEQAARLGGVVVEALKKELIVLDTLIETLGETEAGERVKQLKKDIEALTQPIENTKDKWEEFAGPLGKGKTDTDEIVKNLEIMAQLGGGEFESTLPALAEYNVALIEYEENIAKAQKTAEAATSVITSFGDSFATALLAAEDFGDALKIGMRAAIASMIQMLAEYAYVQAGIAWAEVLKGNFTQAPAAVAWTAAGTAATVAASAVKAMAEGGIVTKPTMALVGERGPEAVIPLSKASGMMPVVNVYVQGSVLEEEGLARRITKVVQGAGRGY